MRTPCTRILATVVLGTALIAAAARAQTASPALEGSDEWLETLSLDPMESRPAGWTPPALGNGMMTFDAERRGEALNVRSRREALRVIARSEVICPADGECPAWVGWLLLPVENPDGGYRVQRCSAFLVREDQVATAGHCLPDGQVAGGVVLFPAQGGQRAERIPVRRVLTNDWREQSDSARLELAHRTRRAPPPVTLELPGTGSALWTANVQAYAWHPARHALYGVVRVQHGEVDLLRTGPCEQRMAGPSIVRGYSGSAVLDERGRVVGILTRAFARPGLGAHVPATCWAQHRRTLW